MWSYEINGKMQTIDDKNPPPGLKALAKWSLDSSFTVFWIRLLTAGIQTTIKDNYNETDIITRRVEKRLHLHNVTFDTPYTKFQCSVNNRRRGRKEISFTIKGFDFLQYICFYFVFFFFYSYFIFLGWLITKLFHFISFSILQK
jgi:hypothetical protein